MLECVSSPESPSEGIPGKGIFSRTNCCHNCKVLRRNEHRTGGVHSVADNLIPLTTLRYPVLLLDFPPRFSPSNRVKLHRELISLRVPLLLFAFIAFAFGWPDKNEWLHHRQSQDAAGTRGIRGTQDAGHEINAVVVESEGAGDPTCDTCSFAAFRTKVAGSRAAPLRVCVHTQRNILYSQFMASSRGNITKIWRVCQGNL